MVKIILVLLYLLKGEVQIERKTFKDMAACDAAGKARVAELVKNPDFDAGLYAGCVPTIVTEVKN